MTFIFGAFQKNRRSQLRRSSQTRKPLKAH